MTLAIKNLDFSDILTNVDKFEVYVENNKYLFLKTEQGKKYKVAEIICKDIVNAENDLI